MKATVTIMFKNGVLDPQGEAVKSALVGLGFLDVKGVRQGKIIELELAEGADQNQVDKMCQQLLVNSVIESYTVEIL
ncbi:MAG: phosphoribosylformylglycinamidine synthase subunit PurS [Planktomarina sp.]|nr:phosphoribosylformylglycinamidine synthase subunit PurS [Planktomarina sp.]MDT2032960.1 phosphoribosylformylglycinamidine synthase subunit PurS [Planktomarina sp.]MDT2039173.1 phosphoribosylformylglycinamidine synthase subunit PurS [Planktomarina sp.]MDT2048986.1 phosphoribosylformylglycinamidine synthase subunit PurS [Planktomarina sp.]